ncbi:isochorismate synthase [Pseudoalteromonas phenolica]|uniref:isochorismate synthase n=1 Tax=Pseudoalteromonas phenolica TaxID=161398 RepID=A0A0S2K0K2_9GAMM|nr:isochorismate synthase [Pseudoalteromonas phenolica]ALO41615.1 hypothetical protein PP2015_1099 [Pseudoalteromonas phenolica]MBE0353835.1 isochorismate synthase [Pseudoalteromonas phenolica O-BC30]RXE91735.1 isochorismate synthase [Pseudoalteromonas phenolica O-BC30]
MLTEQTSVNQIDAFIESFDPSQNALFAAGENCFVTRKTLLRLKTDISNHRELVENITSAINDTDQQDAVAFGVLPFCKSQQAQFIVTDQINKYDKATFTHRLKLRSQLTKNKQANLNKVSHRQDQAHYESAILKAKRYFSERKLDKIVLAKQTDLFFDQDINQTHVIANLLSQSSSGFHFSFPTEQGKTLVGVSPELLLKKQDHSIISNPLAGSTKRVEDLEIEYKRKQALLASQKDRYEHAVVLDEMSQVLNPWCQQLTIPSTPSLLSTATMWHLSTIIEGQLINPNTHILSLANQLHPTPALCGKPTPSAYPLIKELEGEDRDYFSGIIGWCDRHGNGEWVVVIRCGELDTNHARLFAGAGIVAASDPTAEWLETEAKMSTMLNALEAAERYRELTETNALELEIA